MNINISPGNSKLGAIPSISLPSGKTCRGDCECISKCYARKLENLRPNVKSAYEHNLSVLNVNPDTYWREVEASIMMSRFFRFHVSGDIPNDNYFSHMVDIANRNKHCEILCFTKKFGIINKYIENGHDIPCNLHIIFSAWDGLKMENPYLLPEAHVRYKDGHTTARSDAKECGGNCSECAIQDQGCWTIKRGEQVVFNEH
ncbi:MAG: hypothetical protein PUG83_07970 [Clostridiaceae bacterium]|nr:hypothetical protein [Clostridiaceae bacterium]